MRHRKHTFKLGRRSAHVKSLIANQVSSLITYGQITTTIQKAKETRRLAERLVTYAKAGDLHHRRLAIARIKNIDAVKKLFDQIALGFAGRNGGYTKILKIGHRAGDAGELVMLKWVDAASAPAQQENSEKK